jgi:hypothetical protein
MADNIGYTPGTGATIAADEIGGVLYQRVKMIHGADGIAHQTSDSNPMPTAEGGELLEAIEALRFAVAALTKSIGYALPNLSGQPIMEVRQATAANLNVTLASTTLASGTVTTLTNQSQIGGYAANDQIPALMHMQADNLRRNISVT